MEVGCNPAPRLAAMDVRVPVDTIQLHEDAVGSWSTWVARSPWTSHRVAVGSSLTPADGGAAIGTSNPFRRHPNVFSSSSVRAGSDTTKTSQWRTSLRRIGV